MGAKKKKKEIEAKATTLMHKPVKVFHRFTATDSKPEPLKTENTSKEK